ncbi:MAG TPA: hypothetical protein VGO60_00950 [Iamia sp.]|jgi:hypothetical protein|nr:hypothetical protein [Iamia sp.]
MADPGVIALDPARLAGLEDYLQSLSDGCRRRAGRVADEVAGSGLTADHSVAELERLAAACRRERDEVAGRRALLAALPDGLPLTVRVWPSVTRARAAGDALADDVADALAAHPPGWSHLARLLAELDRSAASGPFTAAFFRALGPRRSRELPLHLERAYQRAWTAPLGADGRPRAERPYPDELTVVIAAQTRLAAALRTASLVEGPAALGPTWTRSYTGLPAADDAIAGIDAVVTDAQRREVGEVEQALRDAGYGLTLARSVARSVGWRRAAAVLTVDRGILGLVVAPLALADGDGLECDVPETVLGSVAAAMTVVGAVASLAGAPITVAAGVLSGLALVFGACRSQEARPRETRPTYDPSTGETRLPSGHQSNPHVDGAGVPLPPTYG